MKRIIILAALFGLFSPGYRFAGERMEIVSLRTEYAKVFDNGDGTCTAEIANHPIHEKNVRGKWVDIGENEKWKKISGSIEKISAGRVYTMRSGGEWYEPFDSPYFSAVGWEAAVSGPVTKPAAAREWRSCVTFYLAGLLISGVTDTYYEIYGPEIRSEGAINIVICRDNPKESSSQYIFSKCNGIVVASVGVGPNTSSIRVEYDAMAADVTAQDDQIIFGHTSNDLISVFPSTLGIEATLYLIFPSTVAKEAQTADSIKIYPNPFNPRTTIEFTLRTDAGVNLEIFNISGQKVEALINSYMPAGTHAVPFNADRLASGVYFYRLKAGNSLYNGKLLLVR